MQKFNILIAGCGDVGCALGSILSRQHTVYGLRRSVHKLPDAIQRITADLGDPESMTHLPSVDILVYCAAPSKGAIDTYTATYIEGFRNVIDALSTAPKHIFFTSSTSVYHQDDHQWVNEQSATLPTSEKAKTMQAAEHQVLKSISPATLVRFSGIYGPDRLHLLNQVKAGKVFSSTPIQYSNRIHRDDCAGVLAHLINKVASDQPVERLYLASDGRPAPISEVMQWLAKTTESNTETTKSNRKATSKRCDNRLLVDSGYQFKYPSYIQGYQDIIHNNG
jgi:nucleoside-diphosphate-sugar epimerase